MKGFLNDLSEIQPCGLVDALANNLDTLSDTVRGTFIEGLRQQLPVGLPTSGSVSGSGSVSESGTESGTSALRAGWRQEESSPSNGARSELPAHLLKAARQTLKLNPGGPLEGMVDAFKDILRNNNGGDCLHIRCPEGSQRCTH